MWGSGIGSLGCGVPGWGVGGQGLGLRVEGSDLRGLGLRFGVWGLWFRFWGWRISYVVGGPTTLSLAKRKTSGATHGMSNPNRTKWLQHKMAPTQAYPANPIFRSLDGNENYWTIRSY